jgi:hypothetical protein
MVMTYQLILPLPRQRRKMLRAHGASRGRRQRTDAERLFPRGVPSSWFRSGCGGNILPPSIWARKRPGDGAGSMGNCPQHINTVAFIGAVADIRTCLQALQSGGLVK